MRNRMKLNIVVSLAALALASAVVVQIAVSAQINDIPVFTGLYSEGFETQTRYQFLPHYDVFGGVGDIWQIGQGQGLVIASAWVYYYITYPHSGNFFMGPTYGIGVRWEFDIPAYQFGGYFTTNYKSGGADAFFYDVNGNLIGKKDIQSPAGYSLWTWNGWQFDTPLKYVEIYSDWGAGHIMHDDIQYNPVPEPATILLLGSGLLGFGILRRKFKK